MLTLVNGVFPQSLGLNPTEISENCVVRHLKVTKIGLILHMCENCVV
jgi:hypothetical protein